MHPTSPATSIPVSVTNQPVKLWVYLKAGAIAGLLGAVANNIWNLVSPSFGAAKLPEMINLVSVSMASILPAIVAGFGFWIGTKIFKNNAPMVFGIGAFILTLLSTIGNFKASLPDGSAAPDGFILLTVPMHFIAGAIIIVVILRMVRAANKTKSIERFNR